MIKNHSLTDKGIKVFLSPRELAERFAAELISFIDDTSHRGDPVSISLSGGSTPELLYSILGDNYSDEVSWKLVHFFWGDERCVPPDHPESNYSKAYKAFLGKIDIPPGNIHRIRGEDIPESEALRYSEEISSNTVTRNGLPLLDVMILGLGEDGHTASLFPHQMELLHSERICEVAVHPDTLQRRITLTGGIINNSRKVFFLVTGKRKAYVIEKIIKGSDEAKSFPGYYINPADGIKYWYLDKEAAMFL